MNASAFTPTNYFDLLPVVEDEVDLPHKSGYTGFVPSTPDTPAHSVYKYLYERNKCNFRDFQNIAVNGGDSSNTIKNM